MRYRFLVIGWILFIALHAGKETLMYSWYHYANTSFERAFCVNTDKPELQCHGKCHLVEVVKTNNDVPSSNAPRLPELKDLQFPYAFLGAKPLPALQQLNRAKTYRPTTVSCIGNLNQESVFQPPEH